MRLYDWQSECLEKWEENHYRGIVNVVTGGGKTMLALAAAARLGEALVGQTLKVKIIVPKTFLVYQWLRALKDISGVSAKDIGLYFGAHKGKADKKYMIYVINSARYSFTRHMVDDAENHVFIIADECHHYGAAENSRIFDFMGIVSVNWKLYTLGLSATPYSKNYDDILEPCLGKEIYRFNFVQALDAGIISRFSVLNISLEFTGDERSEYEELSDTLSIALHKLKNRCPYLYSRDSQRFFFAIDNIIKTHKDPDVRRLAQSVLFLSYRRKEIVYSAGARVKCVADLVGLIDKKAKIIIFGERIDMANEIYRHLSDIYPNSVGIYHSKLHKDVRTTTLRQFENSQIRILVSCKTLDEGLNVSDADVGIIASSTASTRQRVQRLGRILRKKEGKPRAYFYYLYVNGTTEESEVLSELNDGIIKKINVIDLYYDEKTGVFSNPYYEELTHMVIGESKNKLRGMEEISELRRNMELGSILCDWWMTENECIRKVKEASTKRERNYYIAMLLLVRARLSSYGVY